MVGWLVTTDNISIAYLSLLISSLFLTSYFHYSVTFLCVGADMKRNRAILLSDDIFRREKPAGTISVVIPVKVRSR